jgi:hypothetical protein
MRGRHAIAVLATVAASAVPALAGVGAAVARPTAPLAPAATPSWSHTVAVPAASLLQRGTSSVRAMSCPAPGDCTAGGTYQVESGVRLFHPREFVVSQARGTWGTARVLAGVPGGGPHSDEGVRALACPAVGDCAAGINFTNMLDGGAPVGRPYLATEVHGTWSRAAVVPGLARLSIAGYAQLSSVACGSAGNCTAGGYYDLSVKQCCFAQEFIVTEAHGTWGQAEPVPGLIALNTGRYAQVDSVACAAAGWCAVGGTYTDRHHDVQAFVADERGGTWRKATGVPGLSTLNTGASNFGGAEVNALSCPRPGTCVAAGGYTTRPGTEAFVATERNGTWGQAQTLGSAAALRPDGSAWIYALSCPAPGDCSAGGQASNYSDQSEQFSTAFVVSESGGTWHAARRAPGLATLNYGQDASIDTIACSGPAKCVAGGYYTGRFDAQPLLTSETGGRWQPPTRLAGWPTSASDEGTVETVACAPGTASACGAGGTTGELLPGQGYVSSRG